ncbi:intercellular adhesion molecule 1 [Fukomys damarensis]|uniref:intercellular adhesion molecule 1 n=1 Tax=Fukomys damarensis TaxID=885580 RepID=UPI001455292F|nr:intercellular adhesion molecule 1 [Fukomys damarensis]
MVSCEAHPGSNVTLSGAQAQPLPHKAQLLLNARAGDNGRIFSCLASLEVAGQLLYKDQAQELTVLYGPRLDESDCPGNWTFLEGSEQTLRCQAWGNPFPKLRCHRKGDNTSLPIGHLRPVRRELAGTYMCRAVSSRGEASREVLVTVLYNEKNMVIVIVLLALAAIVILVAFTAYFYNRQRKISKYRLQKAAEKASKLKALGVPAPDCPDLASSQLQQA